MSRHLSPAMGPRGGAKYVVAGWDRRLQELFLVVHKGPSPTVESITLSEQGFASADEIASRLAHFALSCPDSLFQELRADQVANAGNRIVRHSFTAPIEVLATGD